MASNSSLVFNSFPAAQCSSAAWSSITFQQPNLQQQPGLQQRSSRPATSNPASNSSLVFNSLLVAHPPAAAWFSTALQQPDLQQQPGLQKPSSSPASSNPNSSSPTSSSSLVFDILHGAPPLHSSPRESPLQGSAQDSLSMRLSLRVCKSLQVHKSLRGYFSMSFRSPTSPTTPTRLGPTTHAPLRFLL